MSMSGHIRRSKGSSVQRLESVVEEPQLMNLIRSRFAIYLLCQYIHK